MWLLPGTYSGMSTRVRTQVQMSSGNNSPPTTSNHNKLSRSYTSPPNMPSRTLNREGLLRPVKSIVSASFLYPCKGIWYFLAHREYYPLFGRRLIPLTITSIVVLTLLFIFTYLPQAAFLLIFHGPTAWINAAFLVLGEGHVVTALLFEALLVDETLVDVFDVRPSPLYDCHFLFTLLGTPSAIEYTALLTGYFSTRRP